MFVKGGENDKFLYRNPAILKTNIFFVQVFLKCGIYLIYFRLGGSRKFTLRSFVVSLSSLFKNRDSSIQALVARDGFGMVSWTCWWFRNPAITTLGWCWNPENNGIFTISTGDRQVSSIFGHGSNIPNKHPPYKVYIMGLIVKGTLPKGTSIFFMNVLLYYYLFVRKVDEGFKQVVSDSIGVYLAGA